jgi:hypothetical protein
VTPTGFEKSPFSTANQQISTEAAGIDAIPYGRSSARDSEAQEARGSKRP